MVSIISIFSHRGGQTDYEKARNDPATHNMPAENTLAAFKRVLDAGADGVELDVIRTKDNKLAVIHSANLQEHVFNRASESLGYVGDYTMKELQSNFRVGPRADGIIPELSEVMELIADYQKQGRKITLNIELKDVKGCDIPKSTKTDITPLLADYINQSKLNIDDIILSSFSLKDIVAAEKLNLGVKLAVLFDEKKTSGTPVYINDVDDKYLPFAPENIAMVNEKVPSLYAVHGEIKDVNETCLGEIKSKGLVLGTWSAAENHPLQEKSFLSQFKQMVEKHDVQVNVITNFTDEMKPALGLKEIFNSKKKINSFVERLSELKSSGMNKNI